ncbi:MAG: insulinase family protein [Woeseiaceae bacterium]|nr:insulinase family protein [Woeseiaceae bacterium]
MAAWRAARHLVVILATLLGSSVVHAELDLRNAAVTRLDNGLTVILLADRNFPVVSVQMLYKVGARNEVTGTTGIAHFLEHMAFRDTENFPDTGVVSAIYALGGEWHGYTWTDQTTYYATAPKEHLELLLRIEADRMQRLALSESDVEAERGAVLAELHMYENSPLSMMIDALAQTSFLTHPYRNNTIGWESDIENLSHGDVVDFYRRHYHAGNAVLAVVGDIDVDTTRARVEALFGGLAGGPVTPLPHTAEAVQRGVRRVEIRGPAPGHYFLVGYRAPSANSPDFAAFLVLQQLLGGGSGVSFLQNDWGTPVAADGLLSGAAGDLTTWYPPSEMDYLFVIGGRADDDRAATERAIESRIADLRDTGVSDAALTRAIGNVHDELILDVQTTEDAAHQLAFFEGIGALDVLLTLRARVAAVSAGEVEAAARRYLRPERRTIVWYSPLDAGDVPSGPVRAVAQSPASVTAPAPVDDRRAGPPVTGQLRYGLPYIVMPSDLSMTVHVKLLFADRVQAEGVAIDDPQPGVSSFNRTLTAVRLEQALRDAEAAAGAATIAPDRDAPASPLPATRIRQEIDAATAAQRTGTRSPAPVLAVVAGNVDVGAATALLERYLGDTRPPARPAESTISIARGDRHVRLGIPVAQAQLGYVAAAPPPDSPAADAWRLLLYIFSHDYEGRFGKEAISRRGLAYYVDARYESNGRDGRISLAVGVDPEKVGPLQTLLRNELQRLLDEPPTQEELDDARNHFVGRAVSAAQSNAELAADLATNWLWYGGIVDVEDVRRRVAAVDTDDLRAVAPAFADGLTILVTR